MTPFIDASSLLIVIAGVLGLPVTLLLLGRYRSSVDRIMRRPSDRPGDGGEEVSSGHPQQPHPVAGIGRDRLSAGVARNVTVVVVIGTVVGAAYSSLFLVWNDQGFHPALWAVLAVGFSWPAVLGVWIVDEAEPRWRWTAAAVYVAVLWGVVAGAGAGLDDGFRLWAELNLLPTLVMATFLARSFRAVGTLVLGVILTGLAGAQAVTGLIAGSGAWFGFPLFGVVAASGFAVALAVGWWGAMALAHWYARRAFSDQMLLLGSMCYVFCIDYALRVAVADIGILFWSLAVFVAIGFAAFGLYGLLHRPQPQVPLLILRVFAPESDHHRLLERVAGQWRYLGPVRLIGAPDLALATVEPDEFLTFAAGRLDRLFVRSVSELDDRLEPGPADPDGRHRIEDLFCFDDTWRPAVARLLAVSDGVVLDVRGFTEANRGVVEELELASRAGAISRTVMIVDHTTDRAALDEVLSNLAGAPAAIVEPSPGDADATVTAVLGGIARIGTA